MMTNEARNRALRLETVCEEFESKWRSGQTPLIREHLNQAMEDDRDELFRLLLELDIEYRKKQEEPIDYCEEFPDYLEIISVVRKSPEAGNADSMDKNAIGNSSAPSLSPLDDNVSPLLDGGVYPRAFGNFELQSQIGQGGMGTVYKAWEISVNRFVALKLITFGRFTQPEYFRRFENEAKAAAKLKHSNIVPLHSSGKENGLPYICMGYIDGRSLQEQLKTGPLTPMKAASLISTVAKAIQYAHEKEVLHRDLKPDNILIDQEGDPHVADFGLAKILTEDAGLTETGQVLGTLQYMSPEQAQGQELDFRSDIYSLGATLYAMLTGGPPFEALEGTRESLIEQVLKHEAPRPSHELNIPQDLETICLTCLQKEPKTRYATVQTLVDDLDCFLQGRPIRARPISPLNRLWKWCRRNRTVTSLTGALALLLLTLAIGGPIMAFAQIELRKEAEKQKGDAEQNLRKSQEHEAEAYALAMRVATRNVESLSGPELTDLLALDSETMRRKNLRGFEWHFLWEHLHGGEVAFTGYPGNIHDVAFSPDGGSIVTICDHELERRDVNNPSVKQTFESLNSKFRRVAASPDGRFLATGKVDGTIQVWDLKSAEPVFDKPGHASSILAMTFSSDGETLATSEITLDAAVASSEDFSIRLWDVKAGEPIGTLSGHGGQVTDLAFSKDDQLLASCGTNGTLRLWNLETKTQKSVIRYKAAFTSLAISPDGETVVAGHSDHHLVFWKVKTRDLSVIDAHADKITGVVFTPDGHSIVSSSYDGSIAVWDAISPKVKHRRLAHTGKVNAIDISSDGNRIVSAGDDLQTKLWDLNTPNNILRGHKQVSRVSFSKDSSRLLTIGGFQDRMIKFWNVRTGQLESSVTFKHEIKDAVFSPNGRVVAVAGGHPSKKDNKNEAEWFIKIVDVLSGEILLSISNPRIESIALSLAWSPDENHLAVGFEDGSLWLLNARDGEAAFQLAGHSTYVKSLSFSPDGNILASGSSDQSVKLWQVETGGLIARWPCPGTVWSVAISLDGKSMAAATGETISLWDLEKREPLKEIRTRGGNNLVVAFSPDQKRVAAAGTDRTIRLFNISTGLHCGTFQGHEDWIWSLEFSNDGRTLASGSWDGTVRLWRAATQ